METLHAPTYEEMQRLYYDNFSLGHLNTDINSKFALISLICYLTENLREKNPDVTYYQVIYKLANGIIPDTNIKGLAVMCSDFAYGCKNFPTFGIEDKKIPIKIKEILYNWTPF